MSDNISVLNFEYDSRTAFNQAVLNLLKLDAKGCEIAARMAEAWTEFDPWQPVEPICDEDINRAPSGDGSRECRPACRPAGLSTPC
jgi:hypothetical protein